MRDLRFSLALPSCGRMVESISRRVKRFRECLEAAVVAARGTISISDACAVATACLAEQHVALCAAWLRKKGDAMSHSERLSHANAMLAGSERRDKAVMALKLPGGALEASGGNPADLYASLQAEQAAQRARTVDAGEVTPAPAAAPDEPDGPAPPPLPEPPKPQLPELVSLDEI